MRRIGVIGTGTIGSFLRERVDGEPELELVFMHSGQPEQGRALAGERFRADLSDRDLAAVDLVVEAAHPSVVRRWAERILEFFDGATREAAARFPVNVNVHVALALAGLGPDATHSVVIADPDVTTNAHTVDVEAEGIRFRIEVASEAGGRVSGVYTPLSVWNALRRVCIDRYGLNIV